MAAAPRPSSRARVRTARTGLILRFVFAMSVATVAALSVTTAGHAHEGPATDALAKYDVFLPLEAAPAQAVRRRLETVVRRAHMAGYPLKVAVIGAPVDLGEV